MSVLAAANSHFLYRELCHKDQQQQFSLGGSCLLLQKNGGYIWVDRRNRDSMNKIVKRECRAQAFWPASRPAFVEMEPINDTDQLDQILHSAQELSQPIIIDWMAAWCRKCIYLKPKLEKLAAEYDTKLKFYYVDVNKVPQALVKRGNISV